MAEIAKVVPRIPFAVKPRHRNIKNIEGPFGRIKIIRNILGRLFKYERIELHLPRCDEVRGYAERLVCEAIRHGDKHPPTMDMADFWLDDKQMIHKLFKVLVPRYENYKSSITEMHLIPMRCYLATKSHVFYQLCVLELKGNPFPPMPKKSKPNSDSLTNILLREASKEFKKINLESKCEDKKN